MICFTALMEYSFDFGELYWRSDWEDSPYRDCHNYLHYFGWNCLFLPNFPCYLQNHLELGYFGWLHETCFHNEYLLCFIPAFDLVSVVKFYWESYLLESFPYEYTKRLESDFDDHVIKHRHELAVYHQILVDKNYL